MGNENDTEEKDENDKETDDWARKTPHDEISRECCISCKYKAFNWEETCYKECLEWN